MQKRKTLLLFAFTCCFIVAALIGQTAFAAGAGTPAFNGGKCQINNSLGAPTGLKAVSVADTTADLKWLAPRKSRGVKGYNVYRDNVLVGTTTATTFTDTGLTPNTFYTWTVKSFDSAQKQSKSGAKLTAATCLIITGDVTWDTATAPAAINGGLIVAEGATLGILPGVVVKIMPCQSVTVYGTVNANGAVDAPVVFTSTKDKAYGGMGVNSCGYWNTIKVAQGGIFTGDCMKIVYGSTLFTVQGMLTMTNTEAAYAKTQGIFVDTTGEFDGINDRIHDCCSGGSCKGIAVKGVVNLTSSEIYDCPGSGVLVEPSGTFNGTSVTIRSCAKGVEIKGGINFVLSQAIECNYGLYFNTTSFNGVILSSFMGNNEYGIYNKRPNDVTIDASMNYWGSANGPTVFDEATQTWIGDGDRVSKGVIYDNWLTAPAQ